MTAREYSHLYSSFYNLFSVKYLSMGESEAKELQELKSRLGEMQVALLAAVAEVKALTVLSETLWGQMGTPMPGKKTFSELVHLMKSALLEARISELADTDMIMASQLKANIDRYIEVERSKTATH
jgi:hypothetical protein